MQRKAAEDLRKLVTDALVEAGLVYEGAKAFATPRRLALTVHGLPARSPDVREEKKGPRVGAPREGASRASCKAAGLASIDRGDDRARPKKGEFYVARGREAGPRGRGRASPRSCPAIVRAFPWPKSMRWGDARQPGPALGAPAALDPLHLRAGDRGARDRALRGRRHPAGNLTRGHRFLAPGADHRAALRRLRGRSSRRPRSCSTPTGARTSSCTTPSDLALAQGLELIEDEGLLEEVAGLVEWPVVLMGEFDEAFLDDPAGGDPRHHPRQPEMLRAARRRDGGSPTASSSSPTSRRSDGGEAIVAGNERVDPRAAVGRAVLLDTDQRDLPVRPDIGGPRPT